MVDLKRWTMEDILGKESYVKFSSEERARVDREINEKMKTGRNQRNYKILKSFDDAGHCYITI